MTELQLNDIKFYAKEFQPKVFAFIDIDDL